MINTIKTDIQLTSRGVEVWITTSVSCFLISTSSSVELRLRLCLDIKGKKVRGKIVKGMKVKRKWMESEMIGLVVCYEWKWWESEMKERYVNKKMTKLPSNKNKMWLEKIIKIILWLGIYVISSKKQSFLPLFVQFRGDCILSGSQHKTFFPYLIAGKPNYRKKNIIQPFSPSTFFPYSFSKTKHSLMVNYNTSLIYVK